MLDRRWRMLLLDAGPTSSPALRARARAPALGIGFIAAICGWVACGDGPAAGAGRDGGGDVAPPGEPAFATALASPGDLAALSLGPGGEVKYLAPVEGQPPSPPLTAPCYFQNMRRYSWHVGFLQSFPEYAGLSYDAYLGLVMRPSRRLWGGALRPLTAALHPETGAAGVVAYTIYSESGSLDAAGIVEVDRRLAGCARFLAELLVFVPEGIEQQELLLRERERLASEGVSALF